MENEREEIHPCVNSTYTYDDMLNAWNAGKENYKIYKDCGGDCPSFWGWIRNLYEKEKRTEEINVVEEDFGLSPCPQCGTHAYDGYICHDCGCKII